MPDRTKEDIKQLYKHADVANREMGIVQTDIKWLKETTKKIDARTWTILAVVILGILLQVVLN